MDYGKILKQAYHATFKHKSLWFLGMLVFSGVKFSVPNFGTNSAELFNNGMFSDADPSLGSGMENFGSSIADYWWVIAIVMGLVLVLWLVALVLNNIAVAGMMIGADQARQGGKPTFVSSFKAGLPYFWKVLGMNVLLGLAVGGVVVVISIPLVLLAITIVGLIIAIPGFILLFAALMIVVPFKMYALQNIVLRQQSIMDSYKSAWYMLRHNFGNSIVMVLFLGLIGFGVAFGALIIFGLVAGIFVALGFVAYAVAQWVLVVPIIIIGALVLIILTFLLKGIMTTFKYTVWHLTFIELEQKKPITIT